MHKYITISILVFLFIFNSCGKEIERPKEVQEVHIREGWSFISTYLEINEDIGLVFYDHFDKIECIVHPNDSTLYCPYTNDYSLNRINFMYGYKISASEEFVLKLTGKVCKPERVIFTIPKSTGAHGISNLIPYIRKSSMPVMNVYNEIGDNLTVIKDENGNVFWPSFNVDVIDSLCPGNAYVFFCSELTYYSFPPNDN